MISVARSTTPNIMKKLSAKKTAYLHDFFESLDSDLEIGVATCLSEALNISFAEVMSAYEAWQIA